MWIMGTMPSYLTGVSNIVVMFTIVWRQVEIEEEVTTYLS